MMTALQRSPRFEVSAITLNPGPLADRIAAHGIPVVIIPEQSHSFLAIAREVRRVLGEGRPDIIHAHRYKENLLAALVTGGGRTSRLVQTVHGVLERPDGRLGLKATMIHALNSAVQALCYHRVLAVSRDIEARLRHRRNSARITYVANGIELSTARSTVDRLVTRRSLGVGPDDVLIGTVGRLVPIKGLEVMLAVAARLAVDAPRAKFVVVGDGPLHSTLLEQAAVLGIGDRVTFTGHRTDVPDLVAALDIFLMTSWHEGMPLALLEAMAQSRAVVATRVGGVPEVVEDGVSGLLATAGDATQLADRCGRLIASDELRATMGSAGRRRVQSAFSSEMLLDRLSSIYADVVRSP